MRSYSFFIFLTVLSLLLPGCRPDEKASADLYAAVPKNSVLVMETRDLVKALMNFGNSKIYGEIDSLPPIMDFAEDIRSLKSRFAEDSLLEYFKNRPVLVTASLSGAEKYDLLFIAEVDKQFEKSLGPKLSTGYEVEKRSYSGTDIFRFYEGAGKKSYYISSYKGLFLFSTGDALVQEGIRQLNTEYNIRQEPDFQKLYETSNKKDLANLYINLQELPSLTQHLLQSAEPEFLDRFGSWAELDIQVYEREFIMSGLTLLPESEPYYLQSFIDITAPKSSGQEIVPEGSGLWVSLNFANAEQYYRNYLDYLQRAGRLRKHEQLLEKLNFDPQESLLRWVDTEMGFFASAGKSGQNARVAYFSYRDEEDARQALDSLADPDFVEGYRGIIIKKMAPENALPRFYGNIFKGFHHPYFIIANGYVLFAENLPLLKGVINDVLDGKTLGRNAEFMDFNGKIPSKSHIKVIATNPGFLPILGNLMKESAAEIIEKRSEGLNSLSRAALQINVDDDAAFTNFYLEHSTHKKERVNRIWSTQLESEAANVPQLLKNHVNKKYDIAIQDRDHRLYLLDYDGKILWTKMLDGPIMGDITQVDVYKNNKLQMVVNTPTSLYLIDRLGRDVENFPAELPAAATAPVGVFNYDNARNYRFVVPVGNDLKNYDISGKPVQGWSFKEAESEIITKPQHFSVNRKDVIVVETEEGKLLQLNRRGEKRFETIEGLPDLHIPFYLSADESLAKSEMLTIADDGKLYAIHPGGTADNLYLDEQYPADYFLYFEDRYIFSSDEMLLVKSDESPWSAEFEGDISSKPKAMIFRNEFYAGAFSEDAEEIRLFRGNGELIEGFPVFSQGPFDMGSLKVDGSINIVTYSEDGTLICYRVE